MKSCAPGGAQLFSLRVISFTQRFVTVSSFSCFSITQTETRRKSLLQKFPYLSAVKVRLFITSSFANFFAIKRVMLARHVKNPK